jgi:integrase
MKQLTEKGIVSLKATGKKYYVRERRGFGLCVSAIGTRTFVYAYSWRGQRVEYRLGAYPSITLKEARSAYLEAAALVDRGIDPREAKQEAAAARAKEQEVVAPVNHTFDTLVAGGIPEGFEPSTVGQLAAVYYLRHSKVNHAPRVQELLLHNYRKDIHRIGDRELATFRRKDAVNFLQTIIDRGAPGSARNVAKDCMGMFDHALQREWVEYQPFAKMTKAFPSIKIVHDDRVLSDNELRHFWQILDKATAFPPVKRALKLILLTAQRPGEVVQMHRSQIDGRWWTIPAKVAKNRREHRVYLTDTALALVGNDDGYIFPAFKNGREHIGREALSACTNRGILTKDGRRSGAGKTSEKYFGLKPWRPHDLRRTARTYMARAGVSDEVGEEVINHKKRGMIKVYNQFGYDKEKQEAMEKWEALLLLEILSKPPENKSP